jgi:hypothetical protein
MKPGERIRMIKDAASSLSSRSVAEIQLTLEEFGVETWYFEDSDLDAFTYCTRQLQKSDDSVLVSVQEFLCGEDAAPVESQVLWGPEPGRAFLSHVLENRTLVGEVRTRLPHFGISGFVAHADIDPSKQWRGVIKEALATCHVFVAFIDEAFHESQWCDQEVGWALSRDIPILPIRPREFDRGAERKDGFLEEHQDVFLDDAKSWSVPYWAAEQVFNSLVTHARTREVGVMSLAEAFVNSGSYDQTRRLWSLIERQALIEPPQLRRLEYAVQTNRQVYEAVVPQKGEVTELVKELVQKFEPTPYNEEPF